MHEAYNFGPLLIFGFLSIMLVLGIVVRAKVGLVQRFLFPSCLIGGLVGMAFTNFELFGLKPVTFENWAYHLFNISFISVGLTGNYPDEKGEGGKGLARGALWMALMQGVCFSMQALIGGLCVVGLALAGIELFETFGFLLPVGFNEGPGQALSLGKAWQEMGFEHGATIGLTFASLGFFFAFFVGVPLANWGIRKGLIKGQDTVLPKELLCGINPAECENNEAGRQTIHPANADTLAFQAAMIGLVYLLTYVLLRPLASVIGENNEKLIWGFFFFFGLVVASLIRMGLKVVGAQRLLDPGMQRRLTGWSVDFLIVATVSAIQLVVVWKFILPITMISMIAGIATTLTVVYLGRRLSNYSLERTLAIYGTVTGVTSTGLLLLRVVDPNFKTPVAKELAFMNMVVAPIILAAMVLVSAPASYGWSVWTSMTLLALIMAASLVMLKLFKFIGKRSF